MSFLPIRNKISKLWGVSDRNIIDMTIFLSLQNNSWWNTFITHSLRIWLMTCLTILFDFIVKIHRKRTILTFLIGFMQSLAFFLYLWHKMLKRHVLYTFYLYLSNIYTLDTSTSWWMSASRNYWEICLFNRRLLNFFFYFLFFLFRSLFSINCFM